MEIPDNVKDLLERPIVAALVTLMPDNHPQATPVWMSYDGSRFWVNTRPGRQKARNMDARPQVTLLWIDPDDPLRYLEVRGVVDEVTEAGGLEHINALALRYWGREDFFANQEHRRGETRVIYKIRPVNVVARG